MIAQNLSLVESRIEKACKSANRERSEVVLVAVTKTYPVADVEILANLGLSHFGENRDQEGAPPRIRMELRTRFAHPR